LSDTLAYAALIVSVVAVIPLYIDLIGRYRSKDKIEFELEKYYEPNITFFEGLYMMRVLHPNKPIDHCQILISGQKLPFWDSKKENPIYDHKITTGGGANVFVPETLRKDDAVVEVKDGKKSLKKAKFGEIPQT
jgi:hypothetical protein